MYKLIIVSTKQINFAVPEQLSRKQIKCKENEISTGKRTP
jgi:hypothetical protein